MIDTPAKDRAGSRRFVFAVIGVAILFLIGAALIVTIASRQGKLPLGGGPKPAVKATATRATPTSAVGVVKPSPTPPPTMAPTPTDTPTPAQIVVEGKSQYPRNWPYLAEYKFTLSNVAAMTATINCPECLVSSEQALPFTWVITSSGSSVVRAAVTGNSTAHWTLMVNGKLCLIWTLEPGEAEKPFKAVCVPK